MVEQVKEFGPELESQLLSRPERGVLKGGKIPVVDTLSSEAGIDAWFVAKGICCRLREARRIDPAISSGQSI